jgi:hypothetical protein
LKSGLLTNAESACGISWDREGSIVAIEMRTGIGTAIGTEPFQIALIPTIPVCRDA